MTLEENVGEFDALGRSYDPRCHACNFFMGAVVFSVHTTHSLFKLANLLKIAKVLVSINGADLSENIK